VEIRAVHGEIRAVPGELRAVPEAIAGWCAAEKQCSIAVLSYFHSKRTIFDLKHILQTLCEAFISYHREQLENRLDATDIYITITFSFFLCRVICNYMNS